MNTFYLTKNSILLVLFINLLKSTVSEAIFDPECLVNDEPIQNVDIESTESEKIEINKLRPSAQNLAEYYMKYLNMTIENDLYEPISVDMEIIPPYEYNYFDLNVCLTYLKNFWSELQDDINDFEFVTHTPLFSDSEIAMLEWKIGSDKTEEFAMQLMIANKWFKIGSYIAKKIDNETRSLCFLSFFLHEQILQMITFENNDYTLALCINLIFIKDFIKSKKPYLFTSKMLLRTYAILKIMLYKGNIYRDGFKSMISGIEFEKFYLSESKLILYQRNILNVLTVHLLLNFDRMETSISILRFEILRSIFHILDIYIPALDADTHGSFSIQLCLPLYFYTDSHPNFKDYLNYLITLPIDVGLETYFNVLANSKHIISSLHLPILELFYELLENDLQFYKISYNNGFYETLFGDVHNKLKKIICKRRKPTNEELRQKVLCTSIISAIDNILPLTFCFQFFSKYFKSETKILKISESHDMQLFLYEAK